MLKLIWIVFIKTRLMKKFKNLNLVSMRIKTNVVVVQLKATVR